MPTGSRLAIASLLVLVAASSALLLSTDDAGAADIEHTSDWVISGGTVQVTGKSIDVHGNVSVRGDGVLKLVNCTLDVICASNGQYSLEVLSGGRLEAYDTVIHGSDARFSIRLNDDATLEGCSISHFHGSYSSTRGIVIGGGTTTMVDTNISDGNYHGLYVQSDLLMDNVTISDIESSNIYVYNWGSGGDYALSISNSRIVGKRGVSNWRAGILLYAFSSGDRVDLSVTDTKFSDCYRGVYVSTTGQGHSTVERCTFVDCVQGISMSSQTASGTHVFRDNDISAPSLSNAVGVTVTIRSSFAPVLENNVLSELHTGYVINGRWGGSASGSIGNLTGSDCTRGLVADFSIDLTVHNSSFARMGSSLECFVARNSSTITIIDTEHPWGSGTVEHANSWIRAYIDLEVRGAKWRDGGPIGEGFLMLENVTQYEVARFNLSDLRSQDVTGWEVTDTDRRTSLYLYPALYIEGHGFRGDRIDIREYDPSILELVDDYSPQVTVGEPGEDSGHPTDTVVCRGTYDELGSGLDMMSYSLDGGDLAPLTSWSDGAWNLPLASLADGEHSLSVRATDGVGNVGDTVTVSFLVDTVVPEIELEDYDHLVNTTSIVITGTTEALVTMTVGTTPVEVASDGNFTLHLELEEGGNTFDLMVVDRAGHSEEAQVHVVRDTVDPDLTVLSPEEDLWTNARWVNVEGTAEADVALEVNGMSVTVVNGSFKRRLDLVEGEFAIRVAATDAAGNSVEKVRSINVDWTAPVLELVEPQEPEVYVRESSIYISGDVDDPSIDHVTVNNETVPLTSGRFVKQFTVLEGTSEFVIAVEDAAGNGVSSKVVVIRDLTPPSYESELNALGGELVYVDGDLFCTAPTVEVHLTIDEVSVMTLAGDVPLAQGTEVRHRFDLSEGVNDIDIYIRDEAGNQAQTYSRRVFVDTTAPDITVQSPPAGFRTKEDTVTIGERALRRRVPSHSGPGGGPERVHPGGGGWHGQLEHHLALGPPGRRRGAGGDEHHGRHRDRLRPGTGGGRHTDVRVHPRPRPGRRPRAGAPRGTQAPGAKGALPRPPRPRGGPRRGGRGRGGRLGGILSCAAFLNGRPLRADQVRAWSPSQECWREPSTTRRSPSAAGSTGPGPQGHWPS